MAIDATKAKVIPVPTLSPGGFITAPAEKADYLLSHFYVSDKKQSRLYQDHVANLQHLVFMYGDNAIDFSQNLQIGLEAYLLRYYQAVDVVVNNTDSADNLRGTYDVTASIVITEQGERYEFGHLISMIESKIGKIIRLGNTG